MRYPRNPNVLEYDRSGLNRFGRKSFNHGSAEGHGKWNSYSMPKESLGLTNLDCFRAFPSIPWLKNSYQMNIYNVADTVVYLLVFPHDLDERPCQ